MTTPLDMALVKAREKLVSGPLSEAQVSQGPVKSILQALGWDTFDIDCVIPEYSVGSRRVDYALKASPTPNVFLEIKAPGKADDDADKQLFEYAFHEGVPFAVLTDGRVWNFYLPSGQGSYQDRRLFRLDIIDKTLAECVEKFTLYLNFERVQNGSARDDATKEYADTFQNKKIKELIPKVWKDLLAEPDELICDALIEAVEAEGGKRPSREHVVEFLKTQSSSATMEPLSNIPYRVPAATPNLAKSVSISASNPLRTIGFQLQGSNWKSFNNGKLCYLAIVRELTKRYPDFPQRFKNAKNKGKREWVARSREELFPDQPRLQQSEVTAIGGGWLAGTNISSQSEMPKRIQAACACVGLVFGRDLIANFV